jgi:hypothetical protein
MTTILLRKLINMTSFEGKIVVIYMSSDQPPFKKKWTGIGEKREHCAIYA